MLGVKLFNALILLFFMLGSLSIQAQETPLKMVDENATIRTRALYSNLKKLAKEYTLFGHQDALAYGVEWKEWHKKRSDVHDLCGQYPAVFGWDIGKLGKRDVNIDTVSFNAMRRWMVEAYKMGGINTVSWHVDNFLNDGTPWDTKGGNVVAAILPGGEKHDEYLARLDVVADFFKSVHSGLIINKEVPIIFRPFHEHTGSWFWWGQSHCTPEEYKALWQFTVTYLRDEKEVHNLLYCYSPDLFKDKEHYLERYPGDEYVDILGMDNYHDLQTGNNIEKLTERLRILVELAEEKNKLPAFTETGLSGIPEDNWWTERLLQAIMADEVASRIAWVLVWRNARKDHHYAPYPGHKSASDFLKFCNDPAVLMLESLPKIYKMNAL